MDTIAPEANDPHDPIRAEVRRIMESEGLTQADIARMADVKYGTLTPFMGGTYLGRNDTIAEKIGRWIETRRQTQKTHSVLREAPAFLVTPTASEVTAVLSFAHAAPDFGVVVGGAGIGKTSAIEEYQRVNSNVWLWTAEPSLRKTNTMLAAIAEVMGITQRQSSQMSASIIRRVKGANALIIVDEAQHLETTALDQLRTIHDKGNCGIAVVGNAALIATLKGGHGANDSLYAQLYSRTGMRMSRPKSQAGDLALVLDAWAIEGAQERKLLSTIGRKPGALRIMTKVIRLAFMMAAGGNEPMTVKHIRNAYAQLSSSPLEDAA